ncbi:MAG TPA: hypothetical protein VFS76_17635 [Pyrinomonadaceae bacterium]|nr:hypothetical protein [Pyrinomonadaceae bacterium]
MRKFLRLLHVALTICLLAGVATFILRAAISLQTNGEIDYGEGIVMWQAANVTDWTRAFHPIENYPHNVFHYTPLFHLVSRLVNHFTHNLLVAGRLTSILSLVGTCLVGAFLVARVLPAGRDRWARFIGSLAAGTLIFTTPIWFWSCLMRVDGLAIFLSVCGVALFVLARRHRALGFLALVFFVAAVYTKQTSIAGPAACLILAFIEKPRYAMQLFAFSVALGLAILLMLHIVTDGLFLRHIITYNQNPYILTGLLDKVGRHTAPIVVPLFFAAVFPFALLRRRMSHGLGRYETLRLILTHSDFERCVVVVGLYFVFATALAIATISKVGAYDNYYLEMDVAMCLLAGLFLGWLIRREAHHRTRGQRILQIVVIVLFIIHTGNNWPQLNWTANAYRHPPVEYSPQVVEYIKRLPDPIYSEDMVVLMQAGKEVPAEPAIITALAMDGKWDETGFVDRIKRGEFSAIVIRNSLQNDQRFSKGVVDAIHESYYLAEKIGQFQIYLPQ